ncbi:transmembrane protein [Rhynchospora pubera]|uniref:Transmembrane protein n=1 Tax=Rhynchospora pubera TaxID=906938 RepID=A0AAV8CDG2_9POAL|nr:transmembrane protein [Rhynchospora pubera]
MEGSSTWLESIKQGLRVAYVVLVFCAAFFIGGLKALIVSPFAAAILIVGNIGVILVLFPFHVAWTIYTLIKTNHVNIALKVALLLALPVLFGLWLGLGIFGSILVGLGYGFFTPWISTFEAFRKETRREKFVHGIVDGTWGTIKGSCTVVRDFKDICWHSYPLILKELREGQPENQQHVIRFRDIPSCVIVGIMGIVVDVPFYTIIALIKSPYMLFKGWQRLLQDVISGEGLFLETACIPIAGLAILFWPLVVVGSVVMAIVSSIFVGLYGAVIVYQERSFRRGAAYVVAVVAEFDEYTNDWLYLRDGTILPKPQYRKKKMPYSSELSTRRPDISIKRAGSLSEASEAPGFLVPNLAPSRSVRETIQEVKMLQISENHMRALAMSGKELLDANVITQAGLTEWLNSKGNSGNETIGFGIPSYTMLHSLIYSIKAGANGLLLANGIELTPLNRPKDKIFNWFFHPMMVIKEQIRVLKLSEEEVMFLGKLVLFVGDLSSVPASSWHSESHAPQDPLRAAQIQAISRRLVGITRSMTKFPTYRRRYRQVVRCLINSSTENEGSICSSYNQPVSCHEILQEDV